MNKKLSVFKHYTPYQVIRHPINTLKDIKYTLRDAWQRMTKGYCCYDIWGLSEWFLNIMPEMLEELRTTCHGYPGFEPFDTPEKWDEHLRDLVARFTALQEENWEKRNEYTEEFYNNSERCRVESRNEKTGGLCITWDTDAQYEEIKKKYFARSYELFEEREQLLKELGALFFTHLDKYWD